jgi:MFS family permease
MTATMQKRFTLMLAPALIGLVGVWVLRMLGLIDPIRPADDVWAPVLFVLSVVSAAAAPILIRTLFAHRMRNRHHIPENVFLRFQRLQILVVMATPYLALAAYVLAVPRFYLAGTVLAMLYALYYHYPTTRRLVFDRRIFRVR